MKREPVITFGELMNEVSKYKAISPKRFLMNEQQHKFITAARNKKMDWKTIMKLWVKAGWDKVDKNTIRVALNREILK